MIYSMLFLFCRLKLLRKLYWEWNAPTVNSGNKSHLSVASTSSLVVTRRGRDRWFSSKCVFFLHTTVFSLIKQFNVLRCIIHLLDAIIDDVRSTWLYFNSIWNFIGTYFFSKLTLLGQIKFGDSYLIIVLWTSDTFLFNKYTLI